MHDPSDQQSQTSGTHQQSAHVSCSAAAAGWKPGPSTPSDTAMHTTGSHPQLLASPDSQPRHHSITSCNHPKETHMFHSAQLLPAGGQCTAVLLTDGFGAGQAPQGPHPCLHPRSNVLGQAPCAERVPTFCQLHLAGSILAWSLMSMADLHGGLTLCGRDCRCSGRQRLGMVFEFTASW